MGKKLGMERQRELRRDMGRGKGNKGNIERKRNGKGNGQRELKWKGKEDERGRVEAGK
jgi:hypothetical protein